MVKDNRDSSHSSDQLISKKIIILILVLFIPLTFVATVQHGFIGIFIKVFNNSATIQVFIDLLIASLLILVWMWDDAKKTNRLFWPWALLTMAAGSFGPLFYLLLRKR